MDRFIALPAGAVRFRILNARLAAQLTPTRLKQADEDGFAPAFLEVADGKLAAIGQGSPPDDELPSIDLDGGIVLPAFVDAHVHLDKGHIWPRARNADGSFASAREACKRDRAHWTAADVRARMEFGLRAAYAHGTAAMRTHIDSIDAQTRISWPVLAELRDAWRGRVALQGATLLAADMLLDDDRFANISWAVRECGAVAGCVAYMHPMLEAALDRLFRLAAATGCDLDFHVDETQDPAARSLEVIADVAIARRFQGNILCGHCCSLAMQGEDDARRTIDKVARAGIAVVSLPMCNLYLQDRDTTGQRTPRWRGVTALHELRAAGVPVMIASDNTRDPFYAYGDLDMLEVLREGTRILHLDHPVGDWMTTVGRTPAGVMRLEGCGVIAANGPADLVLTRARNFTELMARPQAERCVLRAGRMLDASPPDYRELDPVLR